MAAVIAEVQLKLPDIADFWSRIISACTDTIDYDLVLSGEVYLELDDGVAILLKPGDCVVQNGTRQAWHNRYRRNV
jgi:hypothetical protein